jgi:hypothetical protein
MRVESAGRNSCTPLRKRITALSFTKLLKIHLFFVDMLCTELYRVKAVENAGKLSLLVLLNLWFICTKFHETRI